MVEGKPISIGNVAYVLGTDAKRLDRWYKDYLSGFREAERDGRIYQDDIEVRREGGRKKIRVPILKESNVGSYMAIDEKTIDGVCYTIISNRETSKVALMADTLRTSELRQVLSKFAVKTKMKVLSVTRDMAPNYDWLARTTFPNAYQVADKFHVLREVLDQLQSVRIRHRQAILALERKKNKTVQEKLTLQEKFSNEETLKQLLHRSRGLLFKRKTEWTDDQKERAKILFKQFPEIEEAYKYCLRIRKWYEPIRPRYSDRKYKIKEADLMLITKEGMESEVEEIRNIANFLRSNSTPHSEVLLPPGEQRQGGGSQPKPPALHQRQLRSQKHRLLSLPHRPPLLLNPSHQQLPFHHPPHPSTSKCELAQMRHPCASAAIRNH